MAKDKITRFASGISDAPYSAVWRMVVQHSDVYLGASKTAMSMFKLSLHESGIWTFAATQQSGLIFHNGNRRAKKWSRPLQHVSGVTRGPSILIPHTSVGSRTQMLGESAKEIHWFQNPEVGELIEFSIYFVQQGIQPVWDKKETILAQYALDNGSHVVLFASKRESPKDFQDACEMLLRENAVKLSDQLKDIGGYFLWFTESRDAYKIPLIIDLPVPICA